MALVCWSGGCDSTLVLADLLADPPKNEQVRSISINHPQQIVDSPRARAARKKLLRVFKKQGFDHQHVEVTFRQSGSFDMEPSGVSQPLVWVLTSVLYLRQNEDLYFGSIKGDDIWHVRNDLVLLMRELGDVRLTKHSLVFPLEWTTKVEVIKRLQEKKLNKFVWYCEDPKEDKVCGRCTSCLTHRTAMWRLKTLGK